MPKYGAHMFIGVDEDDAHLSEEAFHAIGCSRPVDV
jgi:hypothetical protein